MTNIGVRPLYRLSMYMFSEFGLACPEGRSMYVIVVEDLVRRIRSSHQGTSF